MQQKNYNIEIVRALSFVMVIVIHVANYFCRAFERISTGEYIFSMMLNSFARVSVPCFFMISGALLLDRNESMKRSVQRALRFLGALIVWTIVYYIFNTFYMGQTVDLKQVLAVPAEAHLWYLYVMIPIYLIMPFLQSMCRGMDGRLEKEFMILGSILVVLQPVIYYTSPEVYFDVPIFGDRVYIYYLFMGYFLAKYKDRIPKKKGLWPGLFAGASVATVAATVIGSRIIGDHIELFLTYGCPFIIISSASFFIMILQAGNGKIQLMESTRKVIDTCCGCSFGIYLIHIMFLDIFKKHIEAYELSAYWAVPVLVLLILGASFVCVYLIRKTSIGRKIA